MAGEFDGVPYEIGDDLSQAAGVADERGRHVGADFVGQLQSFRVSARGQQFDGGVHAVVQVEWNDIDGELSRFDLREVENVVITVSNDAADILTSSRYPLWRSGPSRRELVMPMTVHRCANLWLILPDVLLRGWRRRAALPRVSSRQSAWSAVGPSSGR